jgi:hypothetical protein
MGFDKTYSSITKQHHSISAPLAMLRQREHRPQEKVLRLLNQRLDARDLRITKAIHDIRADLLSIRTSSFPAIA